MGRKEMKAIVRERIAREKLTIVRPYIIAEIWVSYNGRQARFVGLAKQGPEDTWNETIGVNIARGRAVQQASRRLDRAVLLAGDVVTAIEKITISDDSAVANEQAKVEVVTALDGEIRAYTISGGKPPTVTWEPAEPSVNQTTKTEKASWRDRLNKAPQTTEVAA